MLFLIFADFNILEQVAIFNAKELTTEHKQNELLLQWIALYESLSHQPFMYNFFNSNKSTNNFP